MHININKLYDYSKDKTFAEVKNDIVKKFKIKNIAEDSDEESLYYICDALHEDYIQQRANYEAYIEEGMDARLLMELRKSAIIPMHPDLYDFYDKHKECKTVEDIKSLRANYFKFINSDYADLDWQYHLLIHTFLGYKAKDLIFDYEICFADGDPDKQTDYETYQRDFFEAHTGIKLEIA